MDDSRWHIDCPERDQRVSASTHALCMELDPRRRTLSLDIRVPTARTHELDSGAVVRLFFEGDTVNWERVITWLKGDDAAGHFAAIDEGYAAEMLWSGDWRVTWSDQAADAVDALHEHISGQLSGRS